MPGALDKIRVVDLTSQLSGPYCSMLLADHGADVIKVERPGAGDDVRKMPPFVNGESGPFMMWNRNKRGVALDLKDPADRELLLELIDGADVLLENFRPGVLARQGLGWADLRRRNPRLIYGSISGFGQTGPDAQRGGFDVMAQGISGLMAITGPKDGPPHRLPIPLTDIVAGMFLAIGILAAVEARHSTGKGQYVETSLLEAATAIQVFEAVHYFTTGENPPRMGQAHRGNSPYQIFPTADGYVTIGAAQQKYFESFCERADLVQLMRDPRFTTNADRVTNNDDLVALIAERTKLHPTDWWIDELTALGIPCGPVLTHDRVFTLPQLLHRGMVQEVEHPSAGRVRTLGVPVKLSDTPGAIRSSAPTLGQHTDDVRAELARRRVKRVPSA